ncbi:pyruvate kinase [Geobacillus subterraneus]|uniref:Pyruvate kinase n=2 Tax=Geobacillus TaxID=129337 RepID=A0ABN4NQC8_9BACL|nr:MULTISPECIES: pyruvate kinase [Geobacillus]AMX85176.1 pyruvate kinase [Geobacillus subterraneus]KZS26635.1 pyruvate kinase [Geobacillus subterraneus]OXB91424.1 pyruvate kinase [Geobacillus uzenensis]QIZ68880.1 pyruvate kinase [Geobacillus subterraneus]WPZ17986.1 pyruvate kinase [Geobacillus subterraneus]
MHDKRDLGVRLAAFYREMAEWIGQKRKHFPLPSHEESRDQLLAYLYMKEHMPPDLMEALEEEGLLLGGQEPHLIATVEQFLTYLRTPFDRGEEIRAVTRNEAKRLLDERTEAMFGPSGRSQRTRIMVTMDEAWADEPDIVERLLLYGMDIARINCAYGSPETWETLAAVIRRAEERLQQQLLGKRCRIYMDLPGPKIRVDRLAVHTGPVKLTVPKNEYGEPVQPLAGIISFGPSQPLSPLPHDVSFILQLTAEEEAVVEQGDDLFFADVRGRKRKLKVIEQMGPSCFKVLLSRTAYVQKGMKLWRGSALFTLSSALFIPMKAFVKTGTPLYIYFDDAQFAAAKDERGVKMTTTLAKAWRNVRAGDRLYLNDGQILARVVKVHERCVEAKVIADGGKRKTIKQGTGIHLPDSFIHLTVPPLTDRDLEVIPFIAEHADMVGLSFVHTPYDLRKLYRLLSEQGASSLPVVAKIETREALHNLARIVLEGLKLPAFGVMIARGDLALEVGFEHMAAAQREILMLCRAAHIPVIWATQVLEQLAKKGLPSRAELSDVFLGKQAQCIMLNKGAHIAEAVRLLAFLLANEDSHVGQWTDRLSSLE